MRWPIGALHAERSPPFSMSKARPAYRSSFAAIAVSEYRELSWSTRCRHMVTNASEVSLFTDFQARLTVGSVFPQIACLHHVSPFCRPSSVAHIDFQAIRSGWLTCSAAARHPC